MKNKYNNNYYSKIVLKKRLYGHVVVEKETPNHIGILSKSIIPLDFININVVGGCNFRCKICHTWKDVKTKLSVESCERFLQSISPFVKKEGVTFCYGGGEPLLHDQICDLINLAKRYGYEPSMITNGWLITKRVARDLLKSGLNDIMISLDSNIDSVHDDLRGVKGSFKKIVSAIDILDDLRKKISPEFQIGLTTTVNALNLSTIPNLVRWVKKNEKLSRIRFQVITQVFNTSPINDWYLDNRYSFLWPKDKKLVKKIYSQLIQMKREGYPIESCERNLTAQKNYFLDPKIKAKHSLCGFYKSVFVEVNGNISMCMLNKPIANANDKNLKTKFFRLLIPKEQRYITKCTVVNCHYDMNCRFN